MHLSTSRSKHRLSSGAILLRTSIGDEETQREEEETMEGTRVKRDIAGTKVTLVMSNSWCNSPHCYSIHVHIRKAPVPSRNIIVYCHERRLCRPQAAHASEHRCHFDESDVLI